MRHPKVISFEGLGRCFYDLGPFRPPRAGEFYLSGAIVAAWKAPNDLTTAYQIVRPTFTARLNQVEVPDRQVT